LGIRRSELIQLDVRDLDVERKRVTVQEGKGGKTRVIPITAMIYRVRLQCRMPHEST
jgi:integrase